MEPTHVGCYKGFEFPDHDGPSTVSAFQAFLRNEIFTAPRSLVQSTGMPRLARRSRKFSAGFR